MPLACGDDLSWVDCLFVELLLQNFSILADEEIYTARGFVFVNVDAILAGGFSSPATRSTGPDACPDGVGFVCAPAYPDPPQKPGMAGLQRLSISPEDF